MTVLNDCVSDNYVVRLVLKPSYRHKWKGFIGFDYLSSQI